MKNFFTVILTLSLLFVCVFSVYAGKEATKTVNGFLSVEYNDDGKVTSAVVEVDEIDKDDNDIEVSYKVVLDKKGLELTKSAANKTVTVTGVVKGKGKNFTIQVKSFKIEKDDDE